LIEQDLTSHQTHWDRM